MSARCRNKVWTIGALPLSIACIAACAPCTVAAASGGAIQFRGAIVAPPYRIAAALAAPSAAAVAASAGQSASSMTTITFAAEPNSPPHAAVVLTTMRPANAGSVLKTALPLVAQVSDGDGRRLKPDHRGNYRLGASGGALVLKAPKSAAQTFAVVETSYD